MRLKTFTLSILSIFTALLFLGFASAASLSHDTLVSPASVNNNAGSFIVTYNLKNAGEAADLTYTLSLTSGTATIASATPVSIALGTTASPTSVPSIVTLNFPSGQTGKIEGKIIVDPSGAGSNEEISFSVSLIQVITPSLAITKIKELTLNQNGTLSVANNGNVNFASIDVSSSASYVSVSPSVISLNAGTSLPIAVTLTDSSTLKFGDNPVTITAKSGTTQNTITLPLQKTFCRAGEVGATNLSINRIDISNSGTDDEEWNLLDTITVEVKVENIGDVDVDDIQVELALFDSAGKNMVNDLDFSNTDDEKIDLGDLNDGDDDTVIFEFKVPGDFDSGNYKMAVKAYSKKSGENNICVDTSDDLDNRFYQSIQVKEEDDEGKFISFDNVKLNPTEATCGEKVSFEMNVVNIGKDDQDQVKVNLISKDLELDQSFEIRKNLNQGDDERVVFDFDVPTDVKDKIYTLLLSSEYDYRNGVYREFSDEDLKFALKVIGCSAVVNSGVTGRVASITASLDSEANAGKPLVVETTIKNIGSNTSTFVVGASEYNDWAKLSKVSDRIVTLNAGESTTVTLTFDVNKDASGEQSFFIEAQSGDKVEKREVAVTIAESSTQVSDWFSNNSFVWILGIVILVLIILIIMVSIRLSRR